MHQSQHQYRDQAEITTRNLTQMLESEIAGAIKTDDLALFAVMNEYQRQRAAGIVNGPMLNAYIEQVRSRLPEIDALRITDARGVLVYGNDVAPNVKTSLADRPHFIRLRDDPKAKLVISKPQLSRINQKWVIVFARRIDQPDGSFGGMAFAAVTLKYLSQTFSDLDVGPRGVVVLRDGELGVIARYPEFVGSGSTLGSGVMAREFQEMIMAQQAAGTITARSSLDHIERSYAYRKIRAYPLYILVGLSTDDYLAEWRNEAAKLEALAALFALITLSAAWLIYRLRQRQFNSIETLARQEAKFRTVADFTLDWEYWKGPKQEILYMAPSCERITGYTREEFAADPGLSLRIIHPEDHPLMEQHQRDIAEQSADQDALQVDFRIVRRNGEIRWISHRCRAVSGQHGEPMGRRIGNRDVTEYKRLEQEREQYWRFFQLSTDPMCIADPLGCFKQINPAFVKLTGFLESELISKPFLEFIVPDDRQPTSEEMKLQISVRPSLHFENRYLCKDGTVRDLSWTAYYDRNDRVTYATARDVTAIKQAQAAVLEARDLIDETQKLAKLGGWKYDCGMRQITWTDEVYHIHGVGKDFNPANVESDIQLYSAEDSQTIRTAFEKAVSAGEPFGLELRLNRPDGQRLWVRTTGVPHLNGSQVTSVTGYIIDITERKQADQQLRIAATAFEAQEGMMVTDADGVILRVNRAFVDITGYTPEEAMGRTPSLLKSGRHDEAFYAAMWESVLRLGTWQGEIWNRRKDGKVYPEWLTITAVKAGSGETSHYVATLTDITLRKEADDEIRHLAFYDPLTHLPNRRLLLDRLRLALASSSRSEREGSLLFIDLDNFKILNDTLGHDIGDLLLQQVAQRLTTCIREGDTVARLGGDEFVVMLEDLSENPHEAATQTETVGEKIIDALNQPYLLAGHQHHSTPSIGATLFNKQQNSVDEILKRADLAMYQAKTAGRNTLRFFDPEMQSVITARATLETDLRQGLQQNEFLLYYQSQVDEEGRITGVEALARWQHPRRGLLLPAEFIPLAEETRLILPLGHWVLETACAQLMLWATWPGMAHLTLAVNVSARQFHQPDFVNQVLAVLDQTGANPLKLRLELTESLLLDDVEDIVTKMTALKAKGVGFSLDDFGTGYSSLSYLKRLPLDQLKIDQSFVRNILTGTNDAVIARAIVTLAQSMELGVIAEGVETKEQRDVLARLGCHAFQGYLFGRPLPEEEFGMFLKRN